MLSTINPKSQVASGPVQRFVKRASYLQINFMLQCHMGMPNSTYKTMKSSEVSLPRLAVQFPRQLMPPKSHLNREPACFHNIKCHAQLPCHA